MCQCCPVYLTCAILGVTPESALALIRGLAGDWGFGCIEIPDRAPTAPFRDDVEKLRKINRTVVVNGLRAAVQNAALKIIGAPLTIFLHASLRASRVFS